MNAIDHKTAIKHAKAQALDAMHRAQDAAAALHAAHWSESAEFLVAQAIKDLHKVAASLGMVMVKDEPCALIDAAMDAACGANMAELAVVLKAARDAECEDCTAWVDSDECHLAADRLESAARKLAQKTRAVADYADETAQERA